MPPSYKETNMLLTTQKATYVFTQMNTLLQQIKQRRLALSLKQNDMMLRVGVSRQQYQRLESKGNPRLETLALIAKGLNSELMLIPKEKLGAVMALLEQEPSADTEPTADTQPLATNEQPLKPSKEHVSHAAKSPRPAKKEVKKSLSDDPWQDLLGDDS